MERLAVFVAVVMIGFIVIDLVGRALARWFFGKDESPRN